MGHGDYKQPDGEYVRPSGRYLIDLREKPGVDKHFVRGVGYHQSALARFQQAADVLVELVPEPGNPHDRHAIALHIDRRRIGYMDAEDAWDLQAYVIAHNQQGKAVWVNGSVRVERYSEYNSRGREVDCESKYATVYLPWGEDRLTFQRDSGLPAECDTLIDALPDDVQRRIMRTSQHLDSSDIDTIHSMKHLAPHLAWNLCDDEEVIPNPLHHRLIDRDMSRKIVERLQKLETAEDARRAKHLAAERKLAENKERETSVIDMAVVGHPKGEIVKALGFSAGKVTKILKAANVSAVNPNDLLRDSRLIRCRQALELQRGGQSRRDIASLMGCGPDAVKAMLKDAKFFEEPTSDPGRLELALAVASAEKEVTLEGAAKVLGWTTKAVKSARSDAQALKRVSGARDDGLPQSEVA